MATKKLPTIKGRYVAVRELRYPHATTGAAVRVAPGEQVLNLADSSLALELEAGNIKSVSSVSDPED